MSGPERLLDQRGVLIKMMITQPDGTRLSKKQQGREAEAENRRLYRYSRAVDPWFQAQEERIDRAVAEGRCLSELEWERILGLGKER